jgi:hypothetical protein
MKINIKGSQDLVRDTETMAIINVSQVSSTRDSLYKEKRRKEQEIDSSINSLQADVASIKDNISQILELLNSRGH